MSEPTTDRVLIEALSILGALYVDWRPGSPRLSAQRQRQEALAYCQAANLIMREHPCEGCRSGWFSRGGPCAEHRGDVADLLSPPTVFDRPSVPDEDEKARATLPLARAALAFVELKQTAEGNGPVPDFHGIVAMVKVLSEAGMEMEKAAMRLTPHDRDAIRGMGSLSR